MCKNWEQFSYLRERWCYDMSYNMYDIDYDMSSDYAQMLD